MRFRAMGRTTWFAAHRACAVDPETYISEYAHIVWRMPDGFFTRAPWKCVFAVALICLALPRAQALDQTRAISQYGHTIWRLGQDGLTGTPWSIAQTADGYLWVGTSNGLFRFDGVRFTQWIPPAGERLPSGTILFLKGTRDGSLYIGAESDLARLTGGHLYDYHVTMRWPGPFLEDSRGAVWMGDYGGGQPSHSLCRIDEAHLTCFGRKDGIDCDDGLALTSDKPGSIWVGGWQSICQWQQNAAPQNYPLPGLSKPTDDQSGVWGIASNGPGNIWAGVRESGPGLGLLKFSGSAWKTYKTPTVDGSKLPVSSLLFDRQGYLWIGTAGRGLYKLSAGRLDHFNTENGLSGDTVYSLFEDREGDMWVATSEGLDEFRDLPVIFFSSRDGLSDDTAASDVTTRDGQILIGTSHALNILHGPHITSIKAGHGLPANDVDFLFRDSRNQVWVSGGQEIFLYQDRHFTPVTGPTGRRIGEVVDMAEDLHHNLWASVQVIGPRMQEQTRPRLLLRLKGTHVAEEFPTPENQTIFLAPNPRGGLWIGGYLHGLFWFHGGRFEPIQLRGFNDNVFNLTPEPDGGLWIFTVNHAIFHYQDGRVQSLTMRNGLPCDAGYHIIDDHAGSYWLYMQCGVVRIRDSELEHWLHDPTYSLKTTVLDSRDGYLPDHSETGPVLGEYGRLWDADGTNVQVIDPRHLPWNPLPPPVHIEQLLVDHKDYPVTGRLRLPVGQREIEIDYAGLSYVVPEKVRFRYRLMGHDKDWTDAGGRRQAFYNDLRPGNYTFRVIASNNDGVWNRTGATLSFHVPPAWYQTYWFRTLCVLLLVGLIYCAYLLRMRQYAVAMRVRFNERLDERVRIARELHDTLLQSFHGLMFQFQAARNLLPRRPEAAIQALDEALLATEQSLAEGRDAIHDLRPEPASEQGLAESLTAVGRELTGAEPANGNIPDLRVIVEGKPKELSPIIQDEVYRIGREVIRNAFHHAAANHIEVEIRYDDRELRLRVRDDGKGIDAKVLEASGRPGHWGLPGLRERAQRIGSRLEFWSEASAGTEVELRVPAAVAYEKKRNGHRFRFRLGGSNGGRS